MLTINLIESLKFTFIFGNITIVVEIPLLLLGSILYIFKYKLFFLALTLLIFIFFLVINNLNDQNNIQNKSISNKVNKSTNGI